MAETSGASGKAIPGNSASPMVSGMAPMRRFTRPSVRWGADRHGMYSMKSEQRIIKKYPNRRLYDTSISAYITLSDVKKLIIDYVDVKVVDARSSEDITRQVLLQILLEEEAGREPLLQNEVLIQMIRLYGQTSKSFFAPFLDESMKFFNLQMRNITQNINDQAKTIKDTNDMYMMGRKFMQDSWVNYQEQVFGLMYKPFLNMMNNGNNSDK